MYTKIGIGKLNKALSRGGKHRVTFTTYFQVGS